MDFLLTKYAVEKFVDAPSSSAQKDDTKSSTSSIVWSIFGYTILLAFGAWAAYLSWDANTLVEWNVFEKVIFSLLSALNGMGYLISYWIMKYDLVSALTLLKRPASLVPSVVSIGGRRK
jgi:hypothetical protein